MKGTFLKWPGGKTWFVLAQSDIFPKDYNKYIEPFLGSGAVFFYLKPDEALLSDINQELITTYCSIKNEVDDVCRYLDIHSRKHSKDYYYKIREIKTRATPRNGIKNPRRLPIWANSMENPCLFFTRAT